MTLQGNFATSLIAGVCFAASWNSVRIEQNKSYELLEQTATS